MAEISPLRRRMIEDMTVRNMSPATQRSYISAVSKFSRYFGRSPDRLTLDDVHAFQVHLVSTGISWPGLNQIVCALRFFYGVTLGQATVPERIPYAREPSKLPVVLSADEVVQFLEAVSSLKSRCVDDRLCRRASRLGSRWAQGRRCRQRPWRHSSASRQGRQGSQRDAVAAASGDPAYVLAARQAEDVSIPRPR
jgi:integrase